MADIIEFKHVTKTYGASRGVTDLNFGVQANRIVGFLGPNGAGKTTTISMLVDLTRPTSGSISIFGLDAQHDSLAIRKRIGFLAGDFALDKQLTGRQQLAYFASIRGGVDEAYVSELAERLQCELERPIHTLSRGNKQKIGLISALMHKPELLIFDEPTSGLDPLIQAEFNKILLSHKAAGKTAFISSHVLSEIQELCDEVAFIKEGRLIAVKPLSAIEDGAVKQLLITSRDPLLKAQLTKLSGLKVLAHDGAQLSCNYSGPIDSLLHLLAKHKIDDLTLTEADLEAAFMQYYEGQDV